MKLSKPNDEIKQRVLNDVEFADRLIGYRMHRRAGPAPVSLYSFAEVVGLLLNPHSQLDFEQLAKWVREVITDPELADQIDEQRRRDRSDFVKAQKIRELMALRILQCKSVL